MAKDLLKAFFKPTIFLYHTSSGISPSRGLEGVRFMRSTAIFIASPQKD